MAPIEVTPGLPPERARRLMQQLPLIHGRRSRAKRRHPPLAQLAASPVSASAPTYPGYFEPEEDARTRTFLTGSVLLHASGFALIAALAALAPAIQEHVIPVQLLKETPPPEPLDEEPAPAPKALAER